MKPSSIIVTTVGAISLSLFNTSCQKSEASVAAAEPMAENGAQFKKGEGLSITDEMKASIGLKVEDVAEQKVGSSVALELTAAENRSATAWVSPADAKMIESGTDVSIRAGAESIKGTVRKIETPAHGNADVEITVSTESELPVGTSMKAVVSHPEGEAVAAIPASALLKTAEGTFAYTVNGNFFVRTPVTVGASNDQLVEITDGLYAGDQVVTTPVMSLWMAELQVLRGGKACTCGH